MGKDTTQQQTNDQSVTVTTGAPSPQQAAVKLIPPWLIWLAGVLKGAIATYLAERLFD